MESFLNIPLEARTASGNNVFNYEGVVGDVLISIAARILSKDKLFYIVYVDLCGYPESWWLGNRYKLAEASGDNIKFLELEIRRQLKRLNIKL